MFSVGSLSKNVLGLNNFSGKKQIDLKKNNINFNIWKICLMAVTVLCRQFVFSCYTQ